MSPRFLFSLLIVGLASSVATSAAPEELLKLRGSYRAKLEEVAGAANKALLDKLAATEKELAGGGKIEEALKVREERVRLSLKKDLTAKVREDSGSAELNHIASIYNGSLEATTTPVDKTYLSALEGLERKMSSAGRLDDAIAVKTERARVALRLESAVKKPAEPVGLPENRDQLERYLTNSVWQLAVDRGFSGDALYLALQSDGKAYFWGFSGTWKLDRGGEILTLNAPTWGQGVELKFADDFATAQGTYLKDKAPRFARLAARRTP